MPETAPFANMPSSAEPLSANGLQERLAALLARFERGLLSPCREQTAAARKEMSRAEELGNARLQSRRDDARRAFEQTTGASNSQWEALSASCHAATRHADGYFDTQSTRLRTIRDQANGHLREQGVFANRVPVSSTGLRLSAPCSGDQTALQVRSWVELEEAQSTLLKAKMPEGLTKFDGEHGGCGLLLIALVVGVVAGVSSPQGAGLLSFLLVSAGVYGGIVFGAKEVARRRITAAYERFFQCAVSAESALESQVADARLASRQKTDAERGKNSMANAQAQAVRDESERRSDEKFRPPRSPWHTGSIRALEECRHWVQPNLEELHEEFDLFTDDTDLSGAGWEPAKWRGRPPASASSLNARFGVMSAQTRDLREVFSQIEFPLAPSSEIMNWDFTVPVLMPFTGGKHLLLRGAEGDQARLTATVQATLTRLLATVKPGLLRFTFIDPVGRGANIGALLDLQDHDLRLIDGGIFTEQPQIAKAVERLSEHMDFVIQKYLRTNYGTLQDYNIAEPDIPEAYRVVVVFDYPRAFTPEMASRLLVIAQHGTRCGVHLILAADPTGKPAYGPDPAAIEAYCGVVAPAGASGHFGIALPGYKDWLVRPDQAPDAETAGGIIKQVGHAAADNMRVEIPFERMRQLALKTEPGRWREGSDSWTVPWRGLDGEVLAGNKDLGQTRRGIAVPLGQQGSRKLQWLGIGDEVPHGIIVGSTGSGKSNLLHVLICSLALKYHPDELELYLIDFKQGVEFKAYAQARLPHARVIAIESEREFAFSVIEDLHREMNRRNKEVFRPLGVNGIDAYRTRYPEPMPRILLLVDEYQGFFKAEDPMAASTRRILEELVREGRGSGIHVLLASQSLSGMAHLPASILGQMELRLALKCNEADARVLLEDRAGDARQLTRKGEAIYRAKTDAGLVCERFQVALISEKDKFDVLTEIDRRAAALATPEKSAREPIVFEGNEQPRLEANAAMRALLGQRAESAMPKILKGLLGESLAIRGRSATTALERQAGANLLIVARDESEGTGMLVAAFTGILAQSPAGSLKAVVANLGSDAAPGTGHMQILREGLPSHDIKIVTRRNEVALAVRSLANEVRARVEAGGGQERILLVINGLQRAKALTEDAEPLDASAAVVKERPGGFPMHSKIKNGAADLLEILRDGSEVGVHVLAWCDSRVALERIGPPKRMLQQFSYRAATRMSDTDSNTLLDDNAAGKIDKDGRALFYDENHAGQLLMFRPFALPSTEWLAHFCAILNARA